MGLQFTSGEHIVALEDGRVVRARAVHPIPAGTQPTKASLTSIKTGPWGATEVITQDTKTDAPKSKDVPSVPSPTDPVPRGFRITRDVFEKYSLTKGCPKCEAIRREDDSNTIHHNRECRKRIEAAMTQDVEQNKKLREIEERQNKYLARRVEEHDFGVPRSHSTDQGAAEGGSALIQQATVDHMS